LTALLQARKRQTILIAQQIQVLAMAAEQAHSSDMPRLHSVVSETREVVEIVTKAGGSSAASSHQVAETELLSMIQSSHIVHLACHGIQDKDEPHKSRFCLSTSDLTVSDLISLDLKSAFLAYLSACETAKGDQKYADEVVHLAASMLFAGFQNVVATMW
jgi:CHAT domain-containing protein